MLNLVVLKVPGRLQDLKGVFAAFVLFLKYLHKFGFVDLRVNIIDYVKILCPFLQLFFFTSPE
jgi:hypothetical protein